MVLKHHSAFWAGAYNFAVIANQAAAGRHQQTSNQIQQRGLAHPEVTNQGNELAFFNAQVDFAAPWNCPFWC